LDINTSESQTTAESTNETEKVCSVKEDSNCESTPEVKRKNKSPAASSSNEIMKCLGEIREEQNELIKTIEEQHSDKMKQEDRKLDLMSKIIDALNSNSLWQ
jgi:thymidylate synthase